MHSYSAYGVGIHSEFPLPDFTPGEQGQDVVVRYGGDDSWSEPHQSKNSHVEIHNREARFWFKRAGYFRVVEGSQIEVTPRSEAEERILPLYVQGMMMAMALYQRGLCVLHASVMEIGGNAFAFLGHVGAGKSSTAAALHRRGNALISDDNAAIHWNGAGPKVYPAYPSVKLFPEIAESLGYAETDLRPLHSSLTKMAGSLKHNFSQSPSYLKQLYVLRRDCEEGITLMTQQEAMVELIRHSVPTRWGCTADGDHLQRCARLARELPMFSVRTFDSLAEIPEIARSIEYHCLTFSR